MLAVLCVGCAHSRHAAPEINPEDFGLTIEALGSDAPDSGRRLIAHRLVNRSRSTVCIGGNQKFLVGDTMLQTRILHDGLCRAPLVSVLPGETATWSLAWWGSGCSSKVPAALLKAMPWLKCGAVIELRSQIWLFRLERGAPQRGGTPIMSQPLRIRVGPGT